MMDRALKERIIGAVVLVAVVVLVVPVFLDGPPADEETVTERVPLPGQAGQTMQTVVLNRDRDAPVPSPTVEAVERPEAQIAPTASNSAPAKQESISSAAEVLDEPAADSAPAKESESPSPATSSTGMWAVQLGSFSQQENAEKLAAGLRKQGFAAFLSQIEAGSGQLHRVRIGPQKDREAAEAMAARLATAGHTGQVVPHP
jgi:DedD protein